MSPSLTLSDVLDVKYPAPPAWSADGDFLAATTYEDDGNVLFVTDPDGGRSWRFVPEEGYVTEFTWSPTTSELLVATDAGELFLADPDRRTTDRILSGTEATGSYTWSNDGMRFSFYRDGRPVVRDATTGAERSFDVPERGPFLGEEFDADHYPGENHVFSKRATWRRTFRKVERVLEDER